MSMCNDIFWRQKRNEEICIANSSDVAEYAANFPKEHWSFSFFRENRKKDVQNQVTKTPPRKLRGQVTGVTNHLGRGKRGPVRAKAAPTLQQRQCERLSSAASQDEDHLSVHACWARLRRIGGSLSLWPTGGFVRPPAFHFGAQTTNLVRPLRPWSSGYVVSLRRLAVSRAAPSTLAHRGCGVPSRRNGETNVVSTAS